MKKGKRVDMLKYARDFDGRRERSLPGLRGGKL